MEELDGRQLKYGFLHNHALLVHRLTTSSVLGHVYAQGLVTAEEKDTISRQYAESTKTDILLDIVHRQGVSNPGIYVTFFNLLSDDSVTSGQNIEEVLVKVKKDAKLEEVVAKFQYERRLLEENDRATLLKYKSTIVKSVSVDNILPELISCGVVSAEEKAAIMSDKNLNKQAEQLYQVILDRGSSALDKFVEVLENSDKYELLGSQIRRDRTTGGSPEGPDPIFVYDQYPVEEVLKKGYVPPRQGVYVERKKVLDNIRVALRHLKDREGWVVVHGMAGFGKTVLAAEAVRDATILKEIFLGGVHWLTLGKLTDRYGDVDSAKLLSKLQALILRLDRSNSNQQLPSVETAKNYLQKVMAEQHPRSLLILDDVWSHAVINAFSVRCRLLVTTRVSGLVSPVMVQNVHQLSVSEGFSDHEGKQLLALWLDKKMEELSSYADKVLEYCRGSPMAVALIGGMLRKNSNERKWKAIAEKLESSHLYLSTKINNWSYEHPTLNASIQLTAESLPDEIKNGEYFKKLMVLDYDFPVSQLALSTIWNVDEWNTEKYMDDIMSYSLAQIMPTADESDYPYYTVHDIILDYLKGSVTKDKQRQYHREVVQNYQEKSEGASLSQLEDDGYVFKKLLSHIIEAADFELLGRLLTELQWILSCIMYGDANELLAFYKECRNKVPQNLQTDMKKFELFLSGHMDVLGNNPKRDDILQLALMQPNESEIYNQALVVVSGERRKSWFAWSNKDSDPEKYALKLRIHEEGVSYCQFTEDEDKVISSAGMEVKVWDPSTGMVMSTFKEHTNTVTCCAISSNGKRAVSCAEDNTVKVWETRTLQMLCDFTRHQYGVQCCSLSPDNKFVVSADIDSAIYVWDALTGTVYKQWRLGLLSPAITPTPENRQSLDFSVPVRTSSQESSSSSSEGVLCCSFSPDGTQFVTASQNGIIRLWDLSSSAVTLTFQGHNGQVRCCVFSRCGRRLASASLDHTAKVWDVCSGRCEVTLNHGDEFAVLSCDFSADASKLITGDTSGSVKVWSVPHGVLLQELPIHWDHVTCVRYSPKTQNILSAADQGIIKILLNEEIEMESEQMARAIQYHRRFSAWFIKEGTTYEPLVLCYIQKENKLQLVKGEKAEVVCDDIPTLPQLNPRCWFFSNSGSKVVVGYHQGHLQLIDIASSGDKWTATSIWSTEAAHSKEVLKCLFSPDDSKILSCCYNEHKVWSVSSGGLLASVKARGIGVKPGMFLNDSRRVVSIRETCVLLWDGSSGEELTVFDFGSPEDTILCVNISKDGQRLVASSTSGLVAVWDVGGGLLMKSLVVPLNACARSCALSPDGSLAVAGFDDGGLKVWNVNTKQEVSQQHTGSQYWMIDVAFSPDGMKIVSLCDSIQWWSNRGKHLKSVLLKGTFGKYIRFSPDFHTFVTIDNAGLLYILTSLQVD